MNVLLFGSTGMIGQGVLRECLLDPDIDRVLAVVRQPSGQSHPKLRELVPADFYNLLPNAPDLTGYDTCFFTLGVSSAGMKEHEYRRITYDLTLAAAALLARLNPAMSFLYISGAGTDSTEHGRSMWARVKGQTENALLRLPFRAVYLFRPGLIQPLHGIRSKTRAYRLLYSLSAPLLPMLKAIAPRSITTTEQLGRAMILVAKHGYPKSVIEAREIPAI